MKKVLLFASILMVLAVFFAACDNDTPPAITDSTTINPPETTESVETEPPHSHVWSDWTTSRVATCTNKGVSERACACGEKETMDIGAIGHTPGVEATCTTPQNCTVCGDILAVASGHTPGVEATCTTPQNCTVCGDILAVASGHTPGAKATCTTPQNCTVCGDILAVASGHTYTSQLTNSNVGSTIEISHTCSLCKDTYLENIVPTNFEITKNNREQIGYKGTEGEVLVIPAVFQTQDGAWYRVTAIQDAGFQYCSGLTAIIIPNTVTSIGSWAFYGCTALKHIDIPDTVTTIGVRAFYECTSLEQIKLPASLTGIRTYTFALCSSLTEIIIPNSVTFIESSAFYQCNNLVTLSVPFLGEQAQNAQYAYLGYLFGGSYLGCNSEYVPSSLRTVTLTSGTKIPANAFADCENVTHIAFPENIVAIDEYAFQSCHSLNNFTIPDSVCSIGQGAFSGCKGLTHIILPEGLTGISDLVFAGCTGLKRIAIPDGVRSVGIMAFYNCVSLEEITLPASISDFGWNAFDSCSKLSRVYLSFANTPDSFKMSDTFGDSISSLKTVVVTGGERIPAEAFNLCEALESVTLADTIVSIENDAFRYCQALRTIVIPDSVTSIGKNAFYRCSSLEGVIITTKSRLSSIGNFAFFDCSLLSEILIPNGVTQIGMWAFYGCNSLKNVYYCGTSEEWRQISIGSANDPLVYAAIQYNYDPNHVHDVTVDEAVAPTCTASGLTEGKHCAGCGQIFVQQEVIPAVGHTMGRWVKTKAPTCTSFGEEARNCGNCTYNEIRTISPIAHRYDAGQDICTVCGIRKPSEGLAYTSNGDGTCFVSGIGSCTDTEIVIPAIAPTGDLVTAIGMYAFDGCTSLTSVYIPEGVTCIGEAAFVDCSGLTSIVIPNSVTVIENHAFEGCTGLMDTELPSSLVYIGTQAFANCQSISHITIPASVTSLGSGIFLYCINLRSVTFEKGISISDIPSNSFYSCESLTSVYIPDGVKNIGNNAFGQCQSLTDVRIPLGVESIGKNAFGKCTALTQIHIPNSIRTIGQQAFYLSSITDVFYDGSDSEWLLIKIQIAGNQSMICATFHYEGGLTHEHVSAEYPGVDPTCVTDGYTNGEFCTVCGVKTKPWEIIPATGHTMQNSTCIVCGFEQVDYTDISRYHFDYGYQSLGAMENGENLQAFYIAMDKVLTEFHLNPNMEAWYKSDGNYVVADINYGDCGISHEEACLVANYYQLDHPLYYWIHYWVGWDYVPSCLRIYTVEDYALGSERSKINAMIYAKVEEYANYIHGETSKYSIVLATHDWIATAVEYAYDDNGEPESELWAHRVSGFFLGKNVVCEGYSQTMQLFLRFAGVNSIGVEGFAGESHEWTLIQLDDEKWYWLDLTWDDPSTGKIKYNYFLVTDNQYVNWHDAIDGYTNVFAGNSTFMDSHTPYDMNHSSALNRTYDLPSRSEHVFFDDAILELRETFTVDGCTYALIGHGKVQLVYVDVEGTAMVPEWVEYNGTYYHVSEVGAMNEEGYFTAYECVTSDSVTSIIICSPNIVIWNEALNNDSLDFVVWVH